MIPTLLLLERIGILVGSDTTTFANADNPLMCLAKNDFTPGPGLTLTDLTQADFSGYSSRALADGAQPESLDPATGDVLVDLLPTDGNWLYETTGLTHLPQTIYGFYVTNEDGDALYCAERLETPINLIATNQSFVLPRTYLRFLNNGVI